MTFMPTQQPLYGSQASKKRNYELAQALIQQGSDTSPVQHPLQGLARVLQGAIGGYKSQKLEKQDQSEQAEAARIMAQALQQYKGAPGGFDPATGITWNSPRPPDESGALAMMLSNPSTAPYGLQLQLGDIESQRNLQNKIAEAKALQPLELELARAKASISASTGGDTGVILDRLKNADPNDDIKTDIDAMRLLKGGAGAQGRLSAEIDLGRDAEYEKQSGQNESDLLYKPQIANQTAAQTELGKASGEKQVELSERMAQYQRLEQVVNELSTLGQTATYTGLGRLEDTIQREAGLETGPDAVARTEYISKVDNEILPLLRQTFGAQFTEREGQSLKATLGDPNKSPAEKDAVLRSFIATKQAQIQSLQRQVGPQGQGSNPAINQPYDQIQPNIINWEDLP